MGSDFRAYWDDQDGVAIVEWISGTTCSLADAQSATSQVDNLAAGGRVPVLVDMRGMTTLERSAREHFINDNSSAVAVALLAGSAVNRMIANFFIGLKRFAIPIRIFTDRDDALAWLREHP